MNSAFHATHESGEIDHVRNDRLLRVAFVITGLSTGGAETMLLKMLASIDRTRFDPSVVSLTTKGEIGPSIEALGIPVHCLGMRPGLASCFRLLKLIDYLRSSKPALVQTWMYHADLLGGLAAWLSGVPVVAWGLRHSDLSADKNKRATLWVVRLSAKLSRWLPQGILACSQRARVVHIEAGYCQAKMAVIPNGFDLARFRPDPSARLSVRGELGLSADTPLVGLIARYHPQKNHAGFIDAAIRVIRCSPDVHLLLAGAGVDSANSCLAKAIADSGFGGRFHLLGRRDDAPRLIAALDLLASTSWGEAFPNVLGEAMACGVPCVVTDVGDSAEIIGDTGRVVAPGDMDGLSRHIVELLAQPDLRALMGRRARQRIQARYEIRAITRRYERYYLQLLERS